jgi:hypothetical protein
LRFVSIILACIYSSAGLAHVDTILATSDDGRLEGLPDQYSPASFDSQNYVLSIGIAKLKFPPCVAKYFSAPNSDIEITASWYHNLELMPPYVAFDITPPSMGFKYHLLFNLNTLEPIEFRVDAELVQNSIFMHELVVEPRCLEAIRESYATSE